MVQIREIGSVFFLFWAKLIIGFIGFFELLFDRRVTLLEIIHQAPDLGLESFRHFREIVLIYFLNV